MKHQKLKPSFNSEIDRLIDETDKSVRMGRKLHGIINYIKANGLYSNQEMELEAMNMDRLKVNNNEKQVLTQAWEVRHLHNKQVMSSLKGILDKIEEELK